MICKKVDVQFTLKQAMEVGRGGSYLTCFGFIQGTQHVRGLRSIVTTRTTSFSNIQKFCMLKFTNSTFCPHSPFMCFVWLWEQTAIISLYSINWLAFVMEAPCVLWEHEQTFVSNSDWFCAPQDAENILTSSETCQILKTEERNS